MKWGGESFEPVTPGRVQSFTVNKINRFKNYFAYQIAHIWTLTCNYI